MQNSFSFRRLAMKTSTRYGFTIVELLVVIAIIGVILALVFPAVQQAREAGRRANCTSNLRQLALAALNYQETYKTFPPGCIHSTTNQAHTTGAASPHSVDVPCGMIGWSAFLLPFLEAGETVYKDIDFSLPAFADYCGAEHDGRCDEVFSVLSTTSKGEGNISASRNCPPVLRCPSVPHVALSMKGMKDYAANGAVDYPERVDTNPKNSEVDKNRAVLMGVFYRNSGVALTDIKDGSSHTFLFLEQSAMSLPEADKQTDFGANPFFFVNHGSQGFAVCSIYDALPIDQVISVSPNFLSLDIATRGPRSFHPLGLNSVLGDGSVKYIRETISPSIWEATFTRSQGQYDWSASPPDRLQFGGGLKTAETLK